MYYEYLNGKNLAQLKEMCKERHLYRAGNDEEKLIERLMDPNNDEHRLQQYTKHKKSNSKINIFLKVRQQISSIRNRF